MGFGTGPHAHTPLIQDQWVAGLGRTSQRQAVGRERAPDPWRLTPRQGAPPSLAPSYRPHNGQIQLARAGAVGLMTGPHTHTPLHAQTVGSGPRPHAPRTGGRARESAQLETPHAKGGDASLGAPLCGPHSARSQLGRAAAVGLVTGPHAHPPPAPTAGG